MQAMKPRELSLAPSSHQYPLPFQSYSQLPEPVYLILILIDLILWCKQPQMRLTRLLSQLVQRFLSPASAPVSLQLVPLWGSSY